MNPGRNDRLVFGPHRVGDREHELLLL